MNGNCDENLTVREETNYFWYGFKRFIIYIVLAAIIGGIAGATYGVVKDRGVYTAKESVMLVAKLNGSETSTNVSLSKRIMPSIPVFIKDSECVSTANANYYAQEGKEPAGAVISAGNIDVQYDENSLIFTISYTDSSREEAKKKLAAVRTAAETVLSEEGKLPANVLNLKRLQNKPDVSESRNFWKFTLLGFGAGLVISFIAAVIIRLCDSSLYTAKELEEITGTNVVFIEKAD